MSPPCSAESSTPRCLGRLMFSCIYVCETQHHGTPENAFCDGPAMLPIFVRSLRCCSCWAWLSHWWKKYADAAQQWRLKCCSQLAEDYLWGFRAGALLLQLALHICGSGEDGDESNNLGRLAPIKGRHLRANLAARHLRSSIPTLFPSYHAIQVLQEPQGLPTHQCGLHGLTALW